MRPFHCSNSTDRPGECPARILTLTPWSECLIKHSSHSSHLLLYISLSLYSPLSLPSVCTWRDTEPCPLSPVYTEHSQSQSRGSARKKVPVYFCLNLLSLEGSVESQLGDFCPTNTSDYLSQFDQIQTYQICFHSKLRSQSVTPNPLIISINKVYYIFLLKD